MTIYNPDFKYAAIVLAREVGVDAAAQMLNIAPGDIRRWADTYEGKTFLAPSGSTMRNIIAAALFDMIMRLTNAIGSADLSETPVHQLAVALGILVDKWTILATMASGEERSETLEILRKAIVVPEQ